MTVEYDGTDFCGFQFQPAMRTVAGELEAAFSTLFDAPIKIACAGRTDAGVHATGQVVSCATDRAFPFERVVLALNTVLPHDVRARASEIVADGFSARFHALERRYVYAILRRGYGSALLARRAYHFWRALDVERMRAAVPHLIGERDFRSFCGILPENGNTVRTVKHLAIEERGDLLRVEIAADGFVHRMVRTIVGTLLECGTGRRDPHAMAAVVAARKRSAAGLTAPAHGLYLAGVRYDDGFDSYAEPPIFG